MQKKIKRNNNYKCCNQSTMWAGFLLLKIRNNP